MKAQALSPYDKKFFGTVAEGSLRSARVVIPELLGMIEVKSIVDFGCGQGAWLKACLENGVESVVGLDGHYIDEDTLLIARERFLMVDLQHRVQLDRRFDLALCLEVAEHLPANSARTLVESLAAASPMVLFSAALRGQGGTSHINEQWPAYWELLFAEQGMQKYDVLRPILWRNPTIEPWYRSNLYLYAPRDFKALDSLDRFEPEFVLAPSQIMADATFNWSSRALRCMPVLRKIHQILSRFA